MIFDRKYRIFNEKHGFQKKKDDFLLRKMNLPGKYAFFHAGHQFRS